MKLEYAGLSETGPVRQHNEDAILMRSCEEAGLFLVADGVGGRSSGEVVSGAICGAYDRWWHQDFLPSRGQMGFQGALGQIKEVLLRLNRELVQRFGEMRAGSTIALLFLYQGNCALISAGDSRVYRLRDLSLRQISQDDVYHAKSRMDARQDGRLIGAVGIRTSLEFNARTDTVRDQDWFFLCSDGVYRYVRPSVLRRRLLFGGSFSSPDRVVRKIAGDVIRNGAGDNYSMVFARVRK